MTLREAMHATRALLRDYAGTKVTDAVLVSWLDQGQQDVAALTLCYQRTVTSSSVLRHGKRQYGLVTDLGVTDHLATLGVLLNDTPLLLWVPRMASVPDVASEGGGQPRYYYDFAGELTLLPYPTSTYLTDSYTLALIYAASAPTWALEDASILPAAFAQLPLWFAAMCILWTQRRWQQAVQMFGRYRAGLETYSATMLPQGTHGALQQRVPLRTERDDETHLLRLLAQATAPRRGRRG